MRLENALKVGLVCGAMTFGIGLPLGFFGFGAAAVAQGLITSSLVGLLATLVSLAPRPRGIFVTPGYTRVYGGHAHPVGGYGLGTRPSAAPTATYTGRGAFHRVGGEVPPPAPSSSFFGQPSAPSYTPSANLHSTSSRPTQHATQGATQVHTSSTGQVRGTVTHTGARPTVHATQGATHFAANSNPSAPAQTQSTLTSTSARPVVHRKGP